jgi:predicted nuclease of predicted toxin-antitoxin system
MKVKLDENLPTLLVFPLRALGHDVHTVADEDLAGTNDRRIWEAAQNEKRFWVTQDMDFSDLRRFEPGTHAGILLVRIDSPKFEILTARVIQIFQSEPVDDWAGCFVVASDTKVRVIRPNKA